MLLYPLLGSNNGCSVYSMRCYLRLAHSGSLEQRQARHCHSSTLHPWNHRCIKEISQLDTMCSSGTIDHSCCWVWPCQRPSQHILVLQSLRHIIRGACLNHDWPNTRNQSALYCVDWLEGLVRSSHARPLVIISDNVAGIGNVASQ